MHETSAILHLTIFTFGLLFVAAFVSMVTRRIRLPLSVALVVLGLVVSSLAHRVAPGHGFVAQFAEMIRGVELTPDLILFIFLPTLIFESAYSLDIRELLRNLAPILTLAIPGLLLSTAIVGGLFHLLVGLELLEALLFGALISATDPVAVIAIFKEVGAPKRLVTMVEGESLFNDATAIVVFSILLGMLEGEAASLPLAVLRFLYVFVGGTVVGLVLGYLFAKIIEQVENDELVEITLSTVLAYLSFIVADHWLHVSGVMSTVAAGIMLGSYGRTKISPPVVHFMHSFWRYMAFVANAMIFLMVGLFLPATLSEQKPGALAWPLVVAILAMLVGRAASVFGLVPLISRLKLSAPVDRRRQAVIFWGGLRGAIALALALSLLGVSALREGLGPFILALTAGAVLFTMLVNALTTRRLVHACGLDRETNAERLLKAESMLEVEQEVEQSLEGVRREGLFLPRVLGQLLGTARKRSDTLRAGVDEQHAALADRERLTIHRVQCLSIEKSHFLHLFAEGNLEENTTRDLLHEADLRADRLRSGSGGPAADLEHNEGGGRAVRLLRALPLMGRLAERLQTQRVAAHYESARGCLLAAHTVMDALERKVSSGALDTATHEVLAQEYRERAGRAEQDMDEIAGQFPEYVARVQEIVGTRIALNTERRGYARLTEKGILTEPIHDRLKLDLDERFHRLERQPIKALDVSPRALLASVPLFSGLSPEDLDRVAQTLKPRSSLKGELLFREGEQGDRMYLIGRGVVKVWRGSGPAAIPVATLAAGSFVGEMALLHPAPRTAGAQTATVARLLELTKSDLDRLTTEFPAVAESLERAYQQRLAELKGGSSPGPQ